MACGNSRISTADTLVIGTIQIMIGIFEIFMWYLLLVLYMGQIKGVFGTYEPITYKTGCTLWGIFPIFSGALTLKAAKHPTRSMKLGREVSRILLMFYPLEFAIALTYSICSCVNLGQRREESSSTVADEAMSNF
ncbi:membrane-spanning 4-domains subfamily A member 13 isoform X2 [Lemur catta]|uniref:membrane-spanning 4-domains subfamily A member 13 isoform X2 n=1 Tax=Lemur catta TaxID=9447 RepID=UPI001E26B5F5|nr:membrane-spanning 4-domains subfamily A member 13 isoform X2 [Lemur catta]